MWREAATIILEKQNGTSWSLLVPPMILGAQWLSGRVLDSRPMGRGLGSQRRHCVVSLSKTH